MNIAYNILPGALGFAFVVLFVVFVTPNPKEIFFDMLVFFGVSVPLVGLLAYLFRHRQSGSGRSGHDPESPDSGSRGDVSHPDHDSDGGDGGDGD